MWLPFTAEEIRQIYSRHKDTQRGGYVRALLSMRLGRQPTEQEISDYHLSLAKLQLAREIAEAAQPWHLKKRRLAATERIERIMIKRYGVPPALVDKLIREATEGW